MGFALVCLYSLPVVSSLPALSTAGSKRSSNCSAFNSSSFVINQFQLYPENAKFDPVRCLVYFGYVLLIHSLTPYPAHLSNFRIHTRG